MATIKRKRQPGKTRSADAALAAALSESARRRGRRRGDAYTIRVNRKAKVKIPRVRPHQDMQGDLYCIYIWVATHVGKPKLPVPPGIVIPVDVCVYCTKPKRPCKKAISVSPYPGIVWDLAIGNIPACTNCVNGPHFEFVPA